MGQQYWVSATRVAPAAGASFGTFTTAVTVIPTTALEIIRGGALFAGAATRITVTGGIGTLLTTPGTITFQVMIGNVIAFTTGALQLNATAHTDLPFILEIWLTCLTIGDGTTATMKGQSRASGVMFTETAGQVDEVNGHAYLMAPDTTPAAGTGFDSTTDKVVDFFAGFSISSASNTIQVDQYMFERLNWGD